MHKIYNGEVKEYRNKENEKKDKEGSVAMFAK